MKNDSNVRSNFLDKANGATSILAILAAVAAFPGGLKIYQFMMDASDSKIEQANLSGLGEINIPGIGYVVKEPYASLVLFSLAVLIPVLILIALLIKKRGLGRAKVVGRGLYWLNILLGIGGILGGLGILTKLLSNNLNSISDINTDPANLAIIFGSVVAIITSWFALNFLHQAAKIPAVEPVIETTEDDDNIEERHNDRYRQDDGVNERDLIKPQEVPLNKDLSETMVIPAGPGPLEGANYDRSFVTPVAEVNPIDPSLAASDILIPSQPQVTTPAKPQSDDVIAVLPDLAIQEPLSALSDQTVFDTPIAGPMEQDLEIKAVGTVETTIKTILKRKLIAFPGDNTKVILVMREFNEDELIREWAEIHLKSEFIKNP